MASHQLSHHQMRWLRDMYGICEYKTQTQLVALRLLLDHLIGRVQAPQVALTQFELARKLRAMERSGLITQQGREQLLACTKLGIHPRKEKGLLR